VGWYVATYILRFVDSSEGDNAAPNKRFTTWENTILVKAADLDQAYDKTVEFASRETQPYEGGPDGVDVQWVFEGLVDLLPIYEELADGAEIMWADRAPRTLASIRKQVRQKGQFHQ
jgi:hypothetical protein